MVPSFWAAAFTEIPFFSIPLFFGFWSCLFDTPPRVSAFFPFFVFQGFPPLLKYCASLNVAFQPFFSGTRTDVEGALVVFPPRAAAVLSVSGLIFPPSLSGPVFSVLVFFVDSDALLNPRGFENPLSVPGGRSVPFFPAP